MFASCFVNALVSKGIAIPPETIEDIDDTSLQSLQQMRASTGIQPGASRLPALDPTFSAKVRLRAPPKSLPAFKVFRKLHQILCGMTLGNRSCPKVRNYSQFSEAMLTIGEATMVLGTLPMTVNLTSTYRMSSCKHGAYRGVLSSLCIRQCKLGTLCFLGLPTTACKGTGTRVTHNFNS